MRCNKHFGQNKELILDLYRDNKRMTMLVPLSQQQFFFYACDLVLPNKDNILFILSVISRYSPQQEKSLILLRLQWERYEFHLNVIYTWSNFIKKVEIVDRKKGEFNFYFFACIYIIFYNISIPSPLKIFSVFDKNVCIKIKKNLAIFSLAQSLLFTLAREIICAFF